MRVSVLLVIACVLSAGAWTTSASPSHADTLNVNRGTHPSGSDLNDRYPLPPSATRENRHSPMTSSLNMDYGDPSGALSPPPSLALAEPVTTTTIAIAIGTSLLATLVYDQFTANYVAFSFGYARPDPDATIAWGLGRGEQALATDVDWDGVRWHTGQASTTVGWIWDTLDPKSLSEGNYYNVSRTYKNGVMKDQATGGAPPLGDQGIQIRIDINNLPVGTTKRRISVTGGQAGSFNAIVNGGVAYNPSTDTWQPWQPPTSGGPDSTVASAYASENAEYDVPNVHTLAYEAAIDGAIDVSSALASAINGAGQYESGGTWYYDNISVTVPFAAPVELYQGSQLIPWYSAVMAEAEGEGPIGGGGTPPPSGGVGGIAELPDVDGAALAETGRSSEAGIGVITGITAGTALGLVAIGGAAWYVRRRLR